MPGNILIIVEGQKTEPTFFKRLASVFGLKFEIYCLETNIYSLYSKMKKDDFNVDVKDALLEMHPERRDILSKKFAFTYLIFDCDAHHSRKDEKRTIDDIFRDNLRKLDEMARHFTDETDPSIGKLYINYPMMESFRHCDSFFDPKYEKAEVGIETLSSYKREMNKKKLCREHVNKFERHHFASLIVQNLFKLNKIFEGKWDMPSYSNYLTYSKTEELLAKESSLIEWERKISVINSSLFLVTDYYGNEKGFYDNLSNEKECQ